MIRESQLNAFRLDAAENVFLETSRPAEEFVLGRRHRELVLKLLLNQISCANQVGDLEKFVSDWFDTLRKLNGRQEVRRENAVKKVGDRRLAAVVVDLDAVDKNAQYSLAQSAPFENISDGNCFSSLKAKDILRFSVIPSFRKTSAGIIAYFPRKRKGVNDLASDFKEVA